MAKLSILAGSTSQSVNIFIRDSSSTTGAGLAGLAYNTAGLTAYYSFAGANAASTAITLATLAAVNSAYSSGGFKELDATNMKGWYRLDLPNAVIAGSKGRSVSLHLFGATNMAPCPVEIELTGTDNQDATAGGISRIDAAITTRMATFTVPTNFSAMAITAGGIVQADLQTIKTQTVTCAGGVTVPAATLASTTNITAGTITTVTNLTNAPTAGDFTTTMKTSIGTAVAASAVASVTGNVGGNVFGSVGSVSTGVTLAANQHVIVDSGTVTTVSGQLTAYSSGTGVFSVAALANAPSGGGGGTAPTTAEIVAAITAAGLPITVASTYDPDTGTLTLVRGRDYSATESRALTWGVPNASSLSGATVALLIYRAGSAVVSISGTVANAGTASQSVTFQPTRSALNIPARTINSPYVYEIVATYPSGDQVSLVGPGACVIVQNAAS